MSSRRYLMFWKLSSSNRLLTIFAWNCFGHRFFTDLAEMSRLKRRRGEKRTLTQPVGLIDGPPVRDKISEKKTPDRKEQRTTEWRNLPYDSTNWANQSFLDSIHMEYERCHCWVLLVELISEPKRHWRTELKQHSHCYLDCLASGDERVVSDWSPPEFDFDPARMRSVQLGREA